MEKSDVTLILDTLAVLFPKTHSFLNYTKDYELLFATVLSAQATDESVNEATAVLFKDFPTLESYTPDQEAKIYEDVKRLGLGKTKSLHLVATAQILNETYHGVLPKDRLTLMSLPGVGYKTSGVVLATLYGFPYIPVDTHVQRVSLRLGLVKKTSQPEETEKSLEKLFGAASGIELHHRLILFGRNICQARKPACASCPLADICRYHRHQKS